MIDSEESLSQSWGKVIDHLRKAAENPGHGFRYFALGTSGTYKAPQQRMVVLRQLSFKDQKPSSLLFYTDARSTKIKELDSDDQVSLLFWDSEEKLQLRINGHAEIVRNPEELQHHWETSASRSAYSYTTEKAPGAYIDHPEEGWKLKNPDDHHFCMIRIHIDRMEFLQLRGEKHLRAEWQKPAPGKKAMMRWMVP